MKKTTLWIVALLAVATLAGCNLNKTPAETPVENPDENVIENTVEENVEEENIDVKLPEWAKTSLTDTELEEVIDTHFPKWYTYSVYNTETEESNEWEYTYPEDLSHTLLLPIHATMASREIISSWIEDGMIYTLTNVTLQDDTQVSVLYIVNPETLDLVAANVENGNEITNYQFVY